jgi:RNA polymerase sigma-70 factor (ECF subfamily)
VKALRSAIQPESRAKPEGVVVPLAFFGDDVAMVEALRENHPAAKVALFERYARLVERIITHVIGFDPELADIVQDVFLDTLASIHKLENPQALRPWLSRITTARARKVLRSRSRRAWLRLFSDSNEETRWEPPAVNVDQDVLRALRAVYAVLQRLPADERIAFSLRFVDGMQLTEVADACGVSLATVKRRLARAEQRFLAAAHERPELADWMKEGSRWTNQ